MFEDWVDHDHLWSLAFHLHGRYGIPWDFDMSKIADVPGRMTIKAPGLRRGRWVTTFQGVKQFLSNFDGDERAGRRVSPRVLFLLKPGEKPVRL